MLKLKKSICIGIINNYYVIIKTMETIKYVFLILLLLVPAGLMLMLFKNFLVAMRNTENKSERRRR